MFFNLLAEHRQNAAAVIGAAATIFAATLAILGLFLAFYFNRKLAREDRLAELRRESYVQFSRNASQAIYFLTSLWRPELTLASGFKALGDLQTSVCELRLMADSVTWGKLDEYNAKFLEHYESIYKLKVAEPATEQSELRIKDACEAAGKELQILGGDLTDCIRKEFWLD